MFHLLVDSLLLEDFFIFGRLHLEKVGELFRADGFCTCAASLVGARRPAEGETVLGVASWSGARLDGL